MTCARPRWTGGQTVQEAVRPAPSSSRGNRAARGTDIPRSHIYAIYIVNQTRARERARPESSRDSSGTRGWSGAERHSFEFGKRLAEQVQWETDGHGAGLSHRAIIRRQVLRESALALPGIISSAPSIQTCPDLLRLSS